MQAYRIETVVQEDGTLIFSNLPLKAGSNIEVIILVNPVASARLPRYPLRGQPVTYLNPLESVAEADWSVIP